METTTPQHTPGPWFAEIFPSLKAAKREGSFSWASADAFNGPVGCVWDEVSPGVMTGLPGLVETTAANARLITAAPDLLTALEQIVSALPTNKDWLDPAIEQAARAAIAKAKGVTTR